MQDHESYRRWVGSALRALLSPDVRDSLASWSDVFALVYHTNLDPMLPAVLSRYGSRGRPALDPAAMLRTHLVMAELKEVSMDDFARRLDREPILSILCGFAPGQAPGASTLRDFFRRMDPRTARISRTAFSSRRTRLKLKPGEKMPPRRPGIINMISRAAKQALSSEKAVTSPNDLLLAAVVQVSADKGLLGDPGAIKAAGDGSPFRTRANSYGVKTCSCEGRCDCPRCFTDADARPGWDSRQHHFFFGYNLYCLAAAGTAHNLPLTLGLYGGNRHDATLLPGELVKFYRLHRQDGLRLSHVIGDAAHDQTPIYELLDHMAITPVLDPRDPRALRKAGPLTTPPGVTWDKHGLPVCRKGHRLVRRGRAARGRPRFACPLQNATSELECRRPCPLKDRLLVVNDRKNPRLSGDAPYGASAWERLYPMRTVVERVFASLKDHMRLQHARHRRRYIWLGRLTIAAILLHAKAWLRHATDLPALDLTNS